eukprot:TRINITY_DN10883_c0_g1_i12.p1 TRINITY_DN10883_c0_g1~~TRINITY_DN10883_c0_g1_i12.p1  ORF type:complete len:266 (-),score=-27.35 TRINITY_DN10883_c0_g1_i12:184-981(-)
MCNYVIIIIIIIIMNQPNRLLWLWRLPVRIHTSDIMQQLYLCNHIINYNSLLFGMYIIQKQYLYNYNIQFTIIYYFICTQCNSCICVIIRYILFIIINYLIYPQYYSCMQIQKKCDYYVIIVECIELSVLFLFLILQKLLNRVGCCKQTNNICWCNLNAIFNADLHVLFYQLIPIQFSFYCGKKCLKVGLFLYFGVLLFDCVLAVDKLFKQFLVVQSGIFIFHIEKIILNCLHIQLQLLLHTYFDIICLKKYIYIYNCVERTYIL